MANGRISRLSAFSDILKEDGKRRLSNARRESKISLSDLEASTRTTDVEARTIDGIVQNLSAPSNRFTMSEEPNECTLILDKVVSEVFNISHGNKDVQMRSNLQRETVSIPVEERHFLFKCIRLETLDTICKVLGEFVGTGLLLLFACMGLIQWTDNGQPYFVGGLVFGLTIMFVIQVVGAVSGSHINPAVTLAALIYRRITVRMACLYVVAQFLGAIVGYGVLSLLTPMRFLRPENSVGVCSPSPNPNLNGAQVFFFEYFATTVLIAMCCAAWDPRHAKNQDSMPVKFGLALTVPFIAVSPATGCCINPARAFAPAMYNGDWDKHWAYWIAPLLAAAVTTTVYRGLFYREAPPEKKDI